jgi:hypothetical protein
MNSKNMFYIPNNINKFGIMVFAGPSLLNTIYTSSIDSTKQDTNNTTATNMKNLAKYFNEAERE